MVPVKIMVTAGPTREPIDPVRFISNRSTGKMGHALAAAATNRGHEVVLVSGPVSLEAVRGAVTVRVTTAAEMLAAVREHLEWCDALIMAAAVADWRPAQAKGQKLKKTEMPATLVLERTEDILDEVGSLKGKRVFVGFAAETQNVVEEALRKAGQKGVDLIVANDVSQADSGFAADTNRVTLAYPDGRSEDWPLLGKHELSLRLIKLIEALAGT